MTILASYLRHWSVFSSDHLSLDRENRHKYARTWSWRAVYGTIFKITSGFRNKFYSDRQVSEYRSNLFEDGYWKDFLN